MASEINELMKFFNLDIFSALFSLQQNFASFFQSSD